MNSLDQTPQGRTSKTMDNQSSALGSKLFEGNIGAPYSAFNGQDQYYREMAELVVAEAIQAQASNRGEIDTILELGAGTGVSTKVILERIGAFVTALEPNESMRYFLELNHMGNPNVEFVGRRVQELVEDPLGEFDAIICCQMFHLLRDDLTVALRVIEQNLRPGGTITFDLGPSNFVDWKCRLHDFRSTTGPTADEMITELSHPLYQTAHGAAYEWVKDSIPGFSRENLWAPKGKALSLAELEEAFSGAGLKIIRVNEFPVPIAGNRIVNFVRNAWTTWCRWDPLDKLPIEEKLKIVGAGLKALFDAPPALHRVIAYHPSVVITAIKG